MSNEPDFLGIGAQKAGTTWIHKNLSKHPDLYLPPEKEIHYWDIQYKEMGIDWYESLFARGDVHQVKGEITPSYSILHNKAIEKVYEYHPDMRLFFCMRNPIDRAWSSALMALKRAEMTFDEASDQWFIDHFNSQGSLRRGDYMRTIENWLNVFDHENLMLVFFDDILENPRNVLQNISDHIGVNPDFYDEIPEDELATPVHVNDNQDIRPELRTVLEDLYIPKIDALSEMLNFDLSHWKNA